MSDPNYQPSPPARPATGGEPTLPSFEQLVLAGTLPAGTYLVPADGRTDSIAEVTPDGTILLDDQEYTSPSLAAKADGAEDEDGWLYWSADLARQATILDEVRRTVEPQGPEGPAR